MKIVIVGGSSSLAQALLPVLSKFAEVLTAGRAGCDICMDLAAPAADFNLPSSVDVVINAAAAFGGKSVDDLLQAENINVAGVLKLCAASHRAQVKHLIQISSVFATLEPDSRFFSAYALSKRHADEAAQFFCSSFALPLTILRPSQFYGTGPAARKHQPFLTSIIDKAERGEDIFFYGSNDAKRNFIHVADVAHVISHIVRRGVTGSFSCQSLQDVSYSEVAAAAVNAFATGSQIKFVPEQPDIPDNILPIDDTLFRLIGHYPQISFAEGMEMEASARRAVQ